MATEPSALRAWRAACPNCGAPVEFRSAASASAVCSWCRSTLLRDGEALRRIGVSAELFDDHTPLQLGAAGRRRGEAFTLVGRLQYRYAEGTWNEWHALFDNGRSGWLSEDNGRYVFAFDAPLAAPAPAAASLRAGERIVVDGQAWSVGSVTEATLIAALGELPSPPGLTRSFTVADLRNTNDEVGTLDYGDPAAPKWSIGAPVALSELALSGLAAASEKTLGGRAFACPSCGAALELKLEATQSIACYQCRAVVDVSQGVGAELKHFAQATGRAPQIALGASGRLAIAAKPALPWQVVGYVERAEIPEDPEEERVSWCEYLLYNRHEGFAFLVDADDGWSWVVTLTGVPETSGDAATWQGVRYRKRCDDYSSQVEYVLGEFYWHVKRHQRTRHSDYQGEGVAAGKRLNRERDFAGTMSEVTWSAGETLPAAAVREAFGSAAGAVPPRDALPVASNAASLLAKLFFWGFVIVVLLMLFRCSDDDCDSLRATYGEASQEYQTCQRANRGGGGFRTGGGSFGGFSTGGGGHK